MPPTSAAEANAHVTLRYRPTEHPGMRVFHGDEGSRGLPLLAVASGVFQLERRLKLHPVRRATIPMPSEILAPDAFREVERLLADLLRFVLMEQVDLELPPTSPQPPRKLRTQIDLTPADAICLFSGGVDSYVGLALAAERRARLNAVFCAHPDQSKINTIVQALFRDEFEPRGIPLRLISVPPIGKQGYAQLRGFLYFVSAAAWLALLDASTLLVTECGPTMYQPRFGPLDQVTMTTHPFVVAHAKEVIERLLGRPIELVTPFEDLTKAEVMALAPNRGGLRHTHSCISQRFGAHDGTCYGCVVRRLAALAAGVPDVEYLKDPLLDGSASRGNLLALLRFSLDFVTAPETMEEYEVGKIEAYRKQDLFRRFALDNLAAVHRLIRRRQPVASDVRRIYAYAEELLGGTDLLEDRLASLARRRPPSFAS